MTMQNKCPTCGEELYKYDEEFKKYFHLNCLCRRKEFEQAEREAEDRKLEELRKKLIPNERYRSFRFSTDDGKDPATTNILKRYVDNFGQCRKSGQGLLLWGSVGTGKTFYAMAVANALIDKKIKATYTTLSTVVKIAQDFGNAEKRLNWLLDHSVIIIDDLGAQRDTDFANEQIYRFIDECNTRNICLVITTNLLREEMEAAAKDTSDLTRARIFSRILEKCFPIKVNAFKRRAENQAGNKTMMSEILGIKEKSS